MSRVFRWNRGMKILALSLLFVAGICSAQDSKFKIERCEIIPLANHETLFQIDGVEKTRWHFDEKYPRPFFFPFNGPSGISLTRMGHPGASNHDHHRSIWFAHHDLNGESFWADGKETFVKQKQWIAYEDGDDESIMAATTGWFGKDGTEFMEQEIVAALFPMEGGEHGLEIQITMRPSADRETVELAKTNFGILAVRVSKTLSNHFGGGEISNSEGAAGEKEIFGKSARWMDYSGPVVVGKGRGRKLVAEGITYFDHPENPRYPTHWHVRSDGWMGASFCFNEAFTITKEKPLVLRYLLQAHSGKYDQAKAATVAESFGARPGFEVGQQKSPHRQWEVWRKEK